MLFKVLVYSDDGSEIDYSIDLLRSADAQSFIHGWQSLQDEAAQQRVQPTCWTRLPRAANTISPTIEGNNK